MFIWYRRVLIHTAKALRGWLRALAVRVEQFEHKQSRIERELSPMAKLRMATCMRCFDKDGAVLTERNKCRKCGCYMPIKVEMRSAKCPIGKW